ncbi:FtsJ-like methyltransferase [Phanerochaete sordida]|uniref:FtsJ-like methyltransferase n=1 Tax=Phanerochaete sordida TaxID=48140 RepID=A0A9P3GD26_9APHY|nr:FtsJ-like methyltransferase [Phanerochaete sordida]
MPKQDTPVVSTVEELDALLEEGIRLHGPEDTSRSLEPLFLNASPIYSSLRRLKQLYAVHPSTDERFTLGRIYCATAVTADPLVHMRSFQKAFADMAASSKTLQFASGGVKRFLDLGCSPGGFSNWLLGNNKDSRGVGITLSDEDAKWGMVVEGTQLVKPRYDLRFADIVSLVKDSIAKGEDPIVSDAEQRGGAFDLVIAGAFPTGTVVSVNFRIKLAFSQLLMLLCNIRRGGDAIIVTNTKSKRWIVEIMALLRRCFREIKTGKGGKLHKDRSSCYLICADFCAADDAVAEYILVLKSALDKLEHSNDPKEVQEEPEGNIWPRLLLLSGQAETNEEFFEAEHRFVLDLFEPVWRQQHNAIYNTFTKMLLKGASEKPPPFARIGSVRAYIEPGSVLTSGYAPGVSTGGGQGHTVAPAWRRFAEPPSPTSSSNPSDSDPTSPRETSASVVAAAPVAKYVAPGRRASVSVPPFKALPNWRGRSESSSVPLLTRPRGATVADASLSWRAKS